MSTLALQALEIVVALVGAASGFLSLKLLGRTPQNKAEVLYRVLARSKSWNNFYEKRIADIISDNVIDDDEWEEIIKVIDKIAVEETAKDQSFEHSVEYFARAPRSKKLLISQAISRSLQNDFNRQSN